MRKTLVALAGIVVLALGGVYLYVDRIATSAIEQGGTYALGVQTTVGGLFLRFISGSVQVYDVGVANPPGFERADFLRLGNGHVELRVRQLLGDTVHIPSIVLKDIAVSLEKVGGKTNYQTILDNLAKLESADESESTTEFVIDDILIERVTAHVALVPAGGKLTQIDVEVPEVRLKNVGSDGSGVDVAELSSILTRAILQAVAAKGKHLPFGLAGDLQGRLGKLDRLAGRLPGYSASVGRATDAAGLAVDEAKGVLEGTRSVEDVEKAGKKAIDSVKGLFDRD